MLAADEITATQNAASELVDLALKLKAPFLEAVSLHTEASVLYATGKIRPALEKLRKAWTIFNDIEATYEGARTRMLIGRACLKLGDKDTADMEVEAARWTFHQLGAVPDLERLDSFLKDDANHVHGLTSREQEVLKILATGKTNKEIAANLYISERTVDRHVSNILSKLEVPSRAAATAYAYEHKLV
jgi:DNA-binding CsgD family transcriptional regulator